MRRKWVFALLAVLFLVGSAHAQPRVIVTSDGEIDDECSLVRFLLYANEWDVEGIVTSSSQYHWRGHRWAGDDWAEPYLEAYGEVYPNLIRHDPRYPTAEYLRARTVVGNVDAEGDMDAETPGSELIVRVLLDDSDDRPVWLQAWGGTNTIARALKTIEEKHPEKMAYVADKARFFFIWEQDSTYQHYIRPHWGEYDIPTIISDQFWAIAYQWDEILPPAKRRYFEADWMKQHILEDHGLLCSLYKAHESESHGLSGDMDFESGDFRSEGDSPAFLHVIPTGLENQTHPDWGGWGGRYVRVRDNTWLDPVPEPSYQYPEGRWFTETAWGRRAMREGDHDSALVAEYFKPMWRWADAIQRDFAARADWSVKSYVEANHPPVVELANARHLTAQPGDAVRLSAQGSSDPDGDRLHYRWWQYQEADSYPGTIEIEGAGRQDASFSVPADANTGQTIHVVAEVTDDGSPPLTRYQRVVVEVDTARTLAFPGAEGYGKYTRGGRGGAVYEVTNLRDDGPGSLRAAVEASGPRTVVFRVSGTIDLESPLRISNSYLTIAGQTAPGDGIAIRDQPIIIDADEVIIRYVRVRLGDQTDIDADAISARYVKNLILDHVSASWSIDETVSVYHADSVTVQWSLVSESLYDSRHEKGTHGFGGIWGGGHSTYHHNLLAHHSSRNPRFASGCGHTDFRNNVIYNWGYNSAYGGEQQQVGNPRFSNCIVNMVANYYKPGPATEAGEVRHRIVSPSSRDGAADYGRWYVTDNVVVSHDAVTADNWDGGVQPQDGRSAIDVLKLNEPFPSMPIDQQEAEEAYRSVLAGVGATLPRRDTVDARIIDEVRNGYATYAGSSYGTEHTLADPSRPSGIIDSQADVGGWPELSSAAAPTDTDHDGMPDAWEAERGLDPNDGADRNQVGVGGYTMLEKYLNGIEFDVPVRGVRAVRTSDGAMEVRWTDAYLAEDGFVIERSIDGEPYRFVARVGNNVSSFVDESATGAAEYAYRVHVKPNAHATVHVGNEP